MVRDFEWMGVALSLATTVPSRPSLTQREREGPAGPMLVPQAFKWCSRGLVHGAFAIASRTPLCVLKRADSR
ncbi:hypothetical protein [Paraburkholderia fungorum]|uniref:hypothetical protein n=1 Tax=Paraburkholderia fungorum TaxID=134537 RepID=UPI0038B83DEB